MTKCSLMDTLGYTSNSWQDVYKELQDLYMSVFKWENLPETCNERYIEWSLMVKNQAVFYLQKDINDFVCLKSSSVDKGNLYGDPVRVRVDGQNGFNETLDLRNDGVIIFDNKNKVSPLGRLKVYSKRIWNMEMTGDININHQKTPRIWKATKENQYSIKTMLNRVADYTEDVVIDEILKEGEGFDAVLKPAPFVADKIRIEKNALWSEVMTFCGIESNTAEKKERVSQGEVEVSNGQAHHKLMSRFRERVVAVEKINTKYDLKIEVKLNLDTIKMANVMFQKMMQEGGGEIE